MSDQGPQDPLTGLAQAAAAIHEMFTAYVDAGFTEQQALYLVGRIVAAQVQQGGGA